jgi:hypothetical protein
VGIGIGIFGLNLPRVFFVGIGIFGLNLPRVFFVGIGIFGLALDTSALAKHGTTSVADNVRTDNNFMAGAS